MVRDSVQLETVINTISHEYLLEFTSEYGISEMLHPELLRPGDRIVDFPEGKTNASKDGMPANGTYYVEAVRVLDTHQMDLFSLIRAPNPTKVKTESRPPTDSSGVPSTIKRSPLDFAYEAEASGRETAASEMPPPEEGIDANALPKSLRRDYADLRPSEMDLFSLIRAPNPTKVKTGSRPRAPHELPLLTLTASRVIEMDEPAAATDSSGVPSAIEKSPLDFADEAEASDQETTAPEVSPPEEVPISTVPGGDQAAPVAVEPAMVQESRK
nr:hypothetical protein [Tanacetum cinerariifolium]